MNQDNNQNNGFYYGQGPTVVPNNMNNSIPSSSPTFGPVVVEGGFQGGVPSETPSVDYNIPGVSVVPPTENPSSSSFYDLPALDDSPYQDTSVSGEPIITNEVSSGPFAPSMVETPTETSQEVPVFSNLSSLGDDSIPSAPEVVTEVPAPTVVETPIDVPTPTVVEAPMVGPTPTIVETPINAPEQTIVETPSKVSSPATDQNNGEDIGLAAPTVVTPDSLGMSSPIVIEEGKEAINQNPIGDDPAFQSLGRGANIEIPTPNSNLNEALLQPREDTTGEDLKKVEIDYKPPSAFKKFLLFVFLVGLIAFVIFLPQITDFMDSLKGKEEIRVPEKITTGKLKCSLDKNTKTLDKNYSITFRFTDNELEKTEFSILTKGDATGDEEELNNLAATCKRLEQQASSVNGLYVKCTFTTGKLEEIQSFDLSVLNTEDLSAAFTEAGANRPEYQYKQDMDKIEQQMNASGYTCQRER